MKFGLDRVAVVLALALGATSIACGGGGGSAKGAETTAAASMTPMEELKAMPKDLNADLQGLAKPLDDLDATIDAITSFPERHHVDAASIMGLAKARVDGSKVEINADLKLDAAARAELEAALKGLDDVVAGLKATPEKAASLGKKVVTVSAKLPVMATRVTTEANVKVANPFASAESKASAQKEIQDVTQVQADVKKEIDNVQAKVTEVPGLAAKALEKLGTSFAGGAQTSSAPKKTGKR